MIYTCGTVLKLSAPPRETDKKTLSVFFIVNFVLFNYDFNMFLYMINAVLKNNIKTVNCDFKIILIILFIV